MLQDLPSAELQFIAAFFRDHAKPGLDLDGELCADIADALAEVAEVVTALEALARAYGCLDRHPPAPRSPAQRRALAASAAPLDPEGRVLAFPILPQPMPDAGDAA